MPLSAIFPRVAAAEPEPRRRAQAAGPLPSSGYACQCSAFRMNTTGGCSAHPWQGKSVSTWPLSSRNELMATARILSFRSDNGVDQTDRSCRAPGRGSRRRALRLTSVLVACRAHRSRPLALRGRFLGHSIVLQRESNTCRRFRFRREAGVNLARIACLLQ